MYIEREKDGEGEAVTFRRPWTRMDKPWTRMDEPGRHFSGVKQPSGCRENGVREKRPTSHKDTDQSGTHPLLIKDVSLTLGMTPTRLSCPGLVDEGRATAFPTRSGALISTSERLERPLRAPRNGHCVTGDVRHRGGPEPPRGQPTNGA